MKKISLEDVEKFIGADGHSAEEGSQLATEVFDDAMSRMDILRAELGALFDEYAEYQHGVGTGHERDRVLRLWHEFYTSLDSMTLPDATIPVTKIEDASLYLGHAIATGLDMIVDPDESEVPIDAVFVQESKEQEDTFAKEHDSIDKEFLAKLIKLMVKAGTKSDGSKAAWTIEEIAYGLMAVAPGTPAEKTESSLKYLVKQEVVTVFASGKAGLVFYSVCDKYQSYLDGLVGETKKVSQVDERQEVLKDLREALQSNRDINGNVLPRSLNYLVYDLRDKYKWIDAGYICSALTEIDHCREIGSGKYLWTKSDVVLLKPEKESTDPRAAGLIEAADAIYNVLKSVVSVGNDRIWKEYDISGLAGRGSEFGGKLKDEYLKPDVMHAALSILVAEKKLEVVLPSAERPWMKQQGWRVVR